MRIPRRRRGEWRPQPEVWLEAAKESWTVWFRFLILVTIVSVAAVLIGWHANIHVL